MMENLGESSGATAGPPAGEDGIAPGARLGRLGRLPHPPRDRPGRHGRRLRGRAGLARPARRPQGPARTSSAGRPDAEPRFEREAKAAAKLHHTNIVPVFGVGEHDGTPLLRHAVHPGAGPRRHPGGIEAAAARGRSPRRRPDDRRRVPRCRGRRLNERPGAVTVDGRFVMAADGEGMRRRPRAQRPSITLGRPRRGGSTGAHAGRRASPTWSCSPPRPRCSRGWRRRDKRGRGGRRTGRAWLASASRWRRPSSTPTGRASSIGTSSRRTCCSITAASSGSPTSAWPRSRTSRT